MITREQSATKSCRPISREAWLASHPYLRPVADFSAQVERALALEVPDVKATGFELRALFDHLHRTPDPHRCRAAVVECDGSSRAPLKARATRR